MPAFSFRHIKELYPIFWAKSKEMVACIEAQLKNNAPDNSVEIGEWASSGWINIAGGCCGTTPEHIAMIAESLRGVTPRRPVQRPPALRLAGLEPLNVDERSGEALHVVALNEVHVNRGEGDASGAKLRHPGRGL